SLAIVLLALLAGCAVTAPTQRPQLELPAQWDQAPRQAPTEAGLPAAVTADWWQRFGSAELDNLMRQAMAANHELGAAMARIGQARAAAGIVAASAAPTLSWGANATES